MTPSQPCPKCGGTGRTTVPTGKKKAGREIGCENCGATGVIVTKVGTLEK